MIYRKCLFKSNHCYGKREEVDYDVPFKNLNWPIIYLCEYHRDFKFDYRDALNSRSNVYTSNIMMFHTKELSAVQSGEYSFGYAEKVNFCSSCNGTGEVGDCKGNLELAKPCKACNCTGRQSPCLEC